VEVVEVMPGGSAHSAGLRPGDLLLAVNGRIITEVDDLHQILSGVEPGREFALSILCGGSLLEVSIEPH
jgi:S1-C subfamily serine protease